jgi:DNA invertase Pin-like site-specific DNA recombinase
MIYGYARCSTNDQSTDTQVAELKAAGCQKVFAEIASGAKADRAQLTKLLKVIQPGDTLVVVRLDRLFRSTRHLLNLLHDLGERNIAFKALKDEWCNTSTAHGRLLLTVISGIATFERDLIKARCSEGRARAVARGTKMGRPSKLNHYQQTEALARLALGHSQTDIARTFGVHQTTISALARATEG